MEKAKLGTKETMEILDGLALIAKTAKKITKDGKIGVDDITHLIALSQELDVIVEAFKDAGEALDEVKELEQSEVLDIIGKVYEITRMINEA